MPFAKPENALKRAEGEKIFLLIKNLTKNNSKL